jgi:hypothetical protein
MSKIACFTNYALFVRGPREHSTAWAIVAWNCVNKLCIAMRSFESPLNSFPGNCSVLLVPFSTVGHQRTQTDTLSQ